MQYTRAATLARSATTLVTTGAAQSNHARLTVAAGARLGLDVVLVLAGEPSDPTKLPSDRFQVLTLDGERAEALFTAHVLARLGQDLGVGIKDSFDLIAGRSAGGIVALGLGAGLAPNEIVGHCEDPVKMVFPAARQRPWRRPAN